jgi:acyl transferase domain-containing protein
MNLPITNSDSSQLLKQSIVEMRQLRSRIASLETQLDHQSSTTEPIAIIGMACNFPDAPDLQTYWQNLQTGHCAVREVPPERWNLDQFYDSDHEAAGKMYTRYGCFIDRPGDFDAGFFNISPREAIAMDPQQRLLLETTYRTIEHAGIPVESLRGSKTGVYVGLCFDQWRSQQNRCLW